MKASNSTTLGPASSGRRAQPVRQTRTNPTRTSASVARPVNGLQTDPSESSPPGFFPAITHFTDAITALPNEVIRHLTFLKEVDAKACGPEEQLLRLVDAAMALQPQRRVDTSKEDRSTDQTDSNNMPAEEGAASSAHGTTAENMVAEAPPMTEAEVARRKLFFQLHVVAAEMISTLEEKIHVLSPAITALNKQLNRLDHVFPFVESEFSEEARYGSMTHWAYAEKNTGAASERQRRDLAATTSLAAAAAVVNDREAAARSEQRREAVLAKRQRNHQADLDADELHVSKNRVDNPKKAGGVKNKRPGESPAGAGLGLGVLPYNPPAKKRKTEKTNATERAMGGVLGNTSASKGSAGSPRETPAAEKKRPRQPPAQSGGNRKRNTTNASNGQSPSMASSPVHSTFGAAAKDFRGSPHPTTGRPSSSRARQAPIVLPAQEVAVNGRGRVPSNAAKANGSVANGENTSQTSRGGDSRSSTKPPSSVKDDVLLSTVATSTPPAALSGVVSKMEDITTDGAETSPEKKPSRGGARSASSKTGTPITATFPTDVIAPKRASGPTKAGMAKRSHKKGAGQAAMLAAQHAANPNHKHSVVAQLLENDDGEDGDDGEEDEPRYCYCNGVSYGEMVACDGEGCPREWFHLQCVGLKKPPHNVNWYCTDCKEKKRGATSGSLR